MSISLLGFCVDRLARSWDYSPTKTVLRDRMTYGAREPEQAACQGSTPTLETLKLVLLPATTGAHRQSDLKT